MRSAEPCWMNREGSPRGGAIGAFLSFYFYSQGVELSPKDLNFIGMVVSFPFGFAAIDIQLKNQAQKRDPGWRS